jgi:hypothetical protein
MWHVPHSLEKTCVYGPIRRIVARATFIEEDRPENPVIEIGEIVENPVIEKGGLSMTGFSTGKKTAGGARPPRKYHYLRHSVRSVTYRAHAG